MDIGKAIKEIRQGKNFKQKKLAELCKISITYISQIENNKKDPSLSTLAVISKSLEVPLPIIFFMAIEDCDIPPKKRDFFRQFNPPLMGVIKEYF